MKYIFGPVPSRRLGFSLGVDPVPFKTCTLDCAYCQLGRTPLKTIVRKVYVSPADILRELKNALKWKSPEATRGERKSGTIDYITFSGSGEPTLNIAIGEMIARVKRITDIPIAVLTNGTLLFRKDVQDDLLKADVVLPSLDAASPEVFKKINRPHPSLKLNEIMQGMAEFRRRFKGKIWLEVMLVKGINDSKDAIRGIKDAVEIIKPDRVDLNTVVRPPAEEFARPLTMRGLEKVKKIIGDNCRIIVEKPELKKAGTRPRARLWRASGGVKNEIILLAGRRPVTAQDISNSLGLPVKDVETHLRILRGKDRIKCRIYRERKYYYV